jgi:hypothetical protein
MVGRTGETYPELWCHDGQREDRDVISCRPVSSRGHMSIQADPESIEQIRERLRKMSDLELRQYGRSARVMSDPTKHFGQPNPAFALQLQEARAEWLRRHPKATVQDQDSGEARAVSSRSESGQ